MGRDCQLAKGDGRGRVISRSNEFDSLTVLHCLCNIFGGTLAPSPNTVRQVSLFQLSAEVYVRVTHRRWLQGHVFIDLIKDGHWVVVHTEDVVDVAQYVGIIPKVVSRPGLSLIP